MTMGFCTFQKTSILSPLKLSFSLVFFITVTGAETRPDLEAYAIPPTPLEVAHDFQGICFENIVFKAFQREVRHLNSLSEASSGFLSRL